MILIALLFWTLSVFFLIDNKLKIRNKPLKIIISFFFTLAVISIIFFAALLTKVNYTLLVTVCIALPALFLVYKWGQLKEFAMGIDFKVTKTTIVVLVSILIYSLLFFATTSRWGNWDAWAIWTLHAKFLTYDAGYINLFTDATAWTHADYPLMLPSIIAITWKSFGNSSPLVPVMASYIIGIAVPLTIYFAFKEKNNVVTGQVILILLTCSIIFIPYASSQLSDSLLGLFILFPFVLIYLMPKEKPFHCLFLIGFFAAASGWVKNEGLLFFAIFSFYYLARNFRDLNNIKIYALGTILPLLVLFVFKFFYTPPNDLIDGQNSATLYKVMDIGRYLTIGRYFISTMLNEFGLLSALLVLIFFVDYKYYFSFNFIIILTLLVGYFFIYVVTPNDLEWHLSTSFSRLLHQVLPVFLFTAGVAISKRIDSGTYKHISGIYI